MANAAIDMEKVIFAKDATGLIKRYIKTGNFKAFKAEILKRNNNGIPEEIVDKLWYSICSKLNLSPSSNRYV